MGESTCEIWWQEEAWHKSARAKWVVCRMWINSKPKDNNASVDVCGDASGTGVSIDQTKEDTKRSWWYRSGHPEEIIIEAPGDRLRTRSSLREIVDLNLVYQMFDFTKLREISKRANESKICLKNILVFIDVCLYNTYK